MTGMTLPHTCAVPGCRVTPRIHRPGNTCAAHAGWNPHPTGTRTGPTPGALPPVPALAGVSGYTFAQLPAPVRDALTAELAEDDADHDPTDELLTHLEDELADRGLGRLSPGWMLANPDPALNCVRLTGTVPVNRVTDPAAPVAPELATLTFTTRDRYAQTPEQDVTVTWDSPVTLGSGGPTSFDRVEARMAYELALRSYVTTLTDTLHTAAAARLDRLGTEEWAEEQCDARGWRFTADGNLLP